MDTPADKQVEKTAKRKPINFRDYIMQPAKVVDTDVLINMDDFRLLEDHYAFFITIEPRMKHRIQKEKEEAAARQEKIFEDSSHSLAQRQDEFAYGHLSLSYPQWKQRGRFVKPGEKSKVYTQDGSNVNYALFHFTQTDVAEERYKSLKTKPTPAPKNCACGAPECAFSQCCLDPNS